MAKAITTRCKPNSTQELAHNKTHTNGFSLWAEREGFSENQVLIPPFFITLQKTIGRSICMNDDFDIREEHISKDAQVFNHILLAVKVVEA